MSKVMGEDLPRRERSRDKSFESLGRQGRAWRDGASRSEVDRQGGFGGPRGTSIATRRLRVRGALIG